MKPIVGDVESFVLVDANGRARTCSRRENTAYGAPRCGGAIADRSSGSAARSMITEPTTLATDYALAALTAWLGWRLHQRARNTQQRAVRVWALAFAATAIAGVAGGTYHGFVTALPAPVAAIAWKIATVAVGVAACLLLSGTLMATVGGGARRWLLVLVWLQFVAYLVWMLGHDAFLYVIVEYGSAMLVVLFLVLFNRTAGVQPARRWIVGGICGTLAAAAIQQSGFDIHRHFNHNDLQHLVQMFAVWLLYQGGARLADAGQESAIKAQA